jgi:hypothetical protein
MRAASSPTAAIGFEAAAGAAPDRVHPIHVAAAALTDHLVGVARGRFADERGIEAGDTGWTVVDALRLRSICHRGELSHMDSEQQSARSRSGMPERRGTDHFHCLHECGRSMTQASWLPVVWCSQTGRPDRDAARRPGSSGHQISQGRTQSLTPSLTPHHKANSDPGLTPL